MSWAAIPETERQELLALYRQTRKSSALASVADRYGVSTINLMRRLQEMNQKQAFSRKALDEGVYPPSFPRPLYSSPVIRTNDIILISDMEIPDHDDAMVQLPVLLGMRYNIKKLAIIGDAVKEDVFASWAKSMTSPEDFESEIDALEAILRFWLSWFEEIYIRPGNHDARVAIANGGQIHLGMFLKHIGFKGQIDYHPLRRMWIETDLGLVALYHQKNSSANGVDVARKMYNVEPGLNGRKPYLVFTTHSHHAGFCKSDDGLAGCYSMGCARSWEKTLYANEVPQTAVRWSQSIAMIRNCKPYLFERDMTDWQEVLGEYSKNALVCL